MKLNEFKAWFEGFTESMEGAPNKKQWERIKARVGEIDGIAVSYPVYIDRYVRPYWHTYPGTVLLGSVSTSSAMGIGTSCQNAADYTTAINSTGQDFDGATAMYAAGKAEAAAQ